MTIETIDALDDASSLAATVRRLQARNIVLEAENERLKAALSAKEPKVTALTPKQRKLLDFIVRYQRERRGVSPSFDEMARALGVATRSAVHRMLEALTEKGAVIREPGRARSLRVIDPYRASGALPGERREGEVA